MSIASAGGPTQQQTEAILDSVADGVFTVDGDFRITSFNRAASRITGVPVAAALGEPCHEVLRGSACEAGCPMREAMEQGGPVVSRSVYVVSPDGTRKPISVSCSPLTDESGAHAGGVETFRDLTLVEALRREVDRRYGCADIISRSRRMQEVCALIRAVAASDSTVLIQGASGTGKELVARAIHDTSPRAQGPFVAVNCGALPDTLLESELFGYKAGAFTDARRDKPGRFALAEGGTLFLDEIGDISPALQVRLLRVLQERTYEPLGGTRTVTTDARIVTATNRDLAHRVREGRFRRDLYYRVNVIQIDLPPLRERREDIPLLVEHFVARFNRLQGKDVTGVSKDVMQRLLAHDYPGNIRELENLVERAFVMCPGGRIELRHLPQDLGGGGADDGSASGVGMTLKEMERVMLVDALRRHHGNRKAAARELGLHKSTFFRKVKTYGIDLPDQDGRSGRS